MRKQIFTQNKTSILDQLDGADTLSGKLRTHVVETKDKADYKLQTWVGKPKLPSPVLGESKMYQARCKGGRSEESFRDRTRTLPSLSGYDIELLEAGHIEVESNDHFFRKAKALLGESKFSSLLAEAKGHFLEGKPSKKSPTARLIHYIMEDIRLG